MENKIILSTAHHEPKDNRAEWISPAIVDHNIEEVTSSGGNSANSDGLGTYS